MKLNTLSKIFATKGSFQLSYNFATLLFLSTLTVLGAAAWGGYQYAYAEFIRNHQLLISYTPDNAEKRQTAPVSAHSEQHLQVLTEHIGRIEANLMRINALGERLVEVAELDPQEFNFAEAVPMGGPIAYQDSHDELLHSVKALDAMLTKRMTQISALHVALQTRQGHKELSLFGEGKATATGWISSYYGTRHDPFTGRKVWHAGVDIAGKEGSKVKALAGGVVSYAAPKGGYGHLVEIQHANGLSTRYGHNKEILVQPGDLVKKGQDIALLGSSGRSTGPHLHLEVHQNGEAVDPGKYFPDLRRK